jgi:hypothetical protein
MTSGCRPVMLGAAPAVVGPPLGSSPSRIARLNLKILAAEQPTIQ